MVVSLLEALGIALLGMLVWGLLWAVPAIRMRRNDIADVAWGPGIFLGGLLTAIASGALDEADGRVLLALGMALIAGARLGIHIGRRWRSHGDEDKRYAAMREGWGDAWRSRSLLVVFWFQALLALLVSLPVGVAAVAGGDPGVLALVGVAAWVTGLTMETVSDRQLERFLARKQAGEVEGYLDRGLWRYSRHPNYFGDFLGWLGVGLVGLEAALDAGSAGLVVAAVLGPATIFTLLRFVSGVPMLERGRWGKPAWDDYAARTNAFFPGPPKQP